MEYYLTITVLGIHIISSTAELILYYTGHECSLIVVALCFAQAASSMWLTMDLKKGYPTHTSAYPDNHLSDKETKKILNYN